MPWRVLFSAVLMLGIGAPSVLLAVGKKRPTVEQADPAARLKRTIEVEPIANRFIELPDPDEPVRYYGENIYADLIEHLESTGSYVVVAKKPLKGPRLESQSLGLSNPSIAPDPCLVEGATPPASSRISATINELSFITGSRAERTLYGFKQGQENPYNAGLDENKRNEFPLRKDAGGPGWFENVFADSGDLHTGLELGHEVNFDVLFAGALLKHAEYTASLGLELVFENRFGQPVRRQVTSTGSGFYFDLTAHFNYAGADFMAGLMAARKAALLQAFDRTVASIVKSIALEVQKVPFLARLGARCQGAYYLSAGADSRLAVGQRFYDLTQYNAGVSPAVFTVDQVFQRSSRVSVQGQGGYAIGDELASLTATEPAPQPKPEVVGLASRSLGSSMSGPEVPLQAVDAGQANLDVPPALTGYVQSFLTRLWEGLKALVTLPYRIFRYFNYDQNYNGGEIWQVDLKRAIELSQKSWALRAIGAPQAWGRAHTMGDRRVVVAVIDTGVDYNHRELRRSIYWDGERNMPGWDYYSWDPRPFDDHSHGTQVASVIAGGGAEIMGVAPNVTILPIKAFSPYGITNSAALYSSFGYAISSGARIIVAGWGTQRYSKALEDGVRLAAEHGALVIAGAGDGGVDLRGHPYYPAAFESEIPQSMIVVAGHGADGSLTRTRGMSSNYGSSAVELAAPGEAVRVAGPRDSYGEHSHTGIAAGFVAGAAALLWSKCMQMNAFEIKQALLSGAKNLDSLNGEVFENKALYLPDAIDRLSPVCK